MGLNSWINPSSLLERWNATSVFVTPTHSSGLLIVSHAAAAAAMGRPLCHLQCAHAHCRRSNIYPQRREQLESGPGRLHKGGDQKVAVLHFSWGSQVWARCDQVSSAQHWSYRSFSKDWNFHQGCCFRSQWATFAILMHFNFAHWRGLQFSGPWLITVLIFLSRSSMTNESKKSILVNSVFYQNTKFRTYSRQKESRMQEEKSFLRATFNEHHNREKPPR